MNKVNQLGYNSPKVNGSRAVPLFDGTGPPCGPNPPPNSCNTQDGRCAPHGVLDQYNRGWYSARAAAQLLDGGPSGDAVLVEGQALRALGI